MELEAQLGTESEAVHFHPRKQILSSNLEVNKRVCVLQKVFGIIFYFKLFIYKIIRKNLMKSINLFLYLREIESD